MKNDKKKTDQSKDTKTNKQEKMPNKKRLVTTPAIRSATDRVKPKNWKDLARVGSNANTSHTEE